MRIRNHELKQQLAKFEDGQEDLRSLVKTQGEELARYKHKYTSISKEIKTMKAKENCLKEELLKNAQLQEKIAELQDTIKKVRSEVNNVSVVRNVEFELIIIVHSRRKI